MAKLFILYCVGLTDQNNNSNRNHKNKTKQINKPPPEKNQPTSFPHTFASSKIRININQLWFLFVPLIETFIAKYTQTIILIYYYVVVSPVSPQSAENFPQNNNQKVLWCEITKPTSKFFFFFFQNTSTLSTICKKGNRVDRSSYSF